MIAIIIFFIAHWYLSLFSQTFFHHRYAAHNMFSMTKFWEKFFYFFSWVTQGSSYLSPKAYGVLHRLHHAHADKEEDPHSPKFHPNLFKMMWATKATYSDIFKDRMPLAEKLKKNLPDWNSFDFFAVSWPSRLFWAIAYVSFYIAFAPHWLFFLLLPIHFLMGPVHGAIINWYGHKIGKARYKVDDTSKNMMPVDIFMMGEGYHNNHHSHPARANFGIKWYELDPTYPVIKVLQVLGIIRLKTSAA